jgi:primosomal protein N' (replication factor Y) (superfamily II helicase)
MSYAEVAVHTGVPYRNAFTYSIPPDLTVRAGHGVLVPFGQRTLPGVVVRVSPTPTFDGQVRALSSVVTELPLVLPHLVELALWLSERYIAPLYPCVALMLPPGAERRARVRLRPTDSRQDLSETEQALIEELRRDPDLDPPALGRLLHASGVRRTVDALVRRGALRSEYVLDDPAVATRLEHRLRVGATVSPESGQEPLVRRLREYGGSLPVSAARRLPEWKDSAYRRLLAGGALEAFDVRVFRDPLAGAEYPPDAAPILSEAQQAAVSRILASAPPTGPARANVTLLHGVTGSGKTEVYLSGVSSTLAKGQRAIVLVPEISLTAQTIERFAGRFPGRVAVLHSGLTPGQRYDQWCAVRDDRFDIVIGSRSALFAPVASLGLIVIDEEHEWTYKQQDPQPRYVTRDAAERLAQLTGAPLILGSATPDVVSYSRARRGRYQLVELPQRVRPAAAAEGAVQKDALPEVRIVDLARELREGNRSIFSRALGDALDETLQRGDQTILFLNRRGSASFVLCRDCGHVPRCRRCDVSLAFHGATQRLVCHQCGRSRRAPSVCPRCRGGRIRYAGLGTQRVEDEIRRRFPSARVLRWDRDTARKAADHAAIYRELQAGHGDVLIGTQMIAKGLDLPRVTLVGIVNADLSLEQPEFHSAELAFQLLTQVAGRAGRRDDRGLVILQTYVSNHYVIQAAARHDYLGFYRREMEFRRKAFYPPFARLSRLVYANADEARTEAEARRVAQILRRAIADGTEAGSDILGPVPCPVARIRGRWRWQFLLRCPRPQQLLRDLLLPVGWSVDVDPQAFS